MPFMHRTPCVFPLCDNRTVSLQLVMQRPLLEQAGTCTYTKLVLTKASERGRNVKGF